MQVETGMAVGEENEFYLHLNVLVPKNGLKQNIGEAKLPCQSSLKKKKKINKSKHLSHDEETFVFRARQLMKTSIDSLKGRCAVSHHI